MMRKVDEFEFLKIVYTADYRLFEQLSELDRMCIGSEGWSAESFRSESAKENGYVLCYMCGERVAGLLAGFSAVGEGNITTVAVHPDYRRMGLAESLMKNFIGLLPEDTENVFLEVRESNVPAISLYRKIGFEKVGIRKNFYDNPTENAIIMKKEV